MNAEEAMHIQIKMTMSTIIIMRAMHDPTAIPMISPVLNTPRGGLVVNVGDGDICMEVSVDVAVKCDVENVAVKIKPECVVSVEDGLGDSIEVVLVVYVTEGVLKIV